MRFDLTDLRLFVHVHDAGTITGGAEASHMTLASASERIRGMESTLGTPLLLRDRRGVQPTPAGRTLLHHARLVLQQVARLQGELGDHGSGLRGHVRLLSNTSALSEHLPGVLGAFLAQHPRLSIDLEERTSREIAQAVRDDACDLGIAADSADLEGLESVVFRPDPLVLVVPLGHPLAAQRSTRLADALDAPFIGLLDGMALQALVAEQARRLGRWPDYRVRLRSFESVCRLVGEGVGVAVVPQAVAARCARGAKIRRVALADAWAKRRLMLCARRFEHLSPHARQLAQHLLGERQPLPPIQAR